MGCCQQFSSHRNIFLHLPLPQGGPSPAPSNAKHGDKCHISNRPGGICVARAEPPLCAFFSGTVRHTPHGKVHNWIFLCERIGYSEGANPFREAHRPGSTRFIAVLTHTLEISMYRFSGVSTGYSALLLCGLSLAMVRPVAAQTDLTGYWDSRTPNPSGDGTFRDTYFQIQQSGETISGSLIRGKNGIPITGTFKDGAIHFVTVPPPPPAPPAGSTAPARPGQRPITFDGTYDGGKLLLETQGRNGAVKSVAEKVTKEATMPPAPLPLPALKDLPDNGLARTPPMGWNSWNKFAGRVDDAAVRGMADAMVSSGMSKAGYVYINIDDTWELGRDANGNITSNKKFPDMKALADYVHSKGLKIGIYSSPGPKTCAGYEGSYDHVVQDAKTYAAWGIDYLKYDLCSALEIYKDDAPTLQAIYQEMGEELEATHRPIIYSLCEYGRAQPWSGWGEKTTGNLWRTTGDISDRWESMDRIGFSQI